MKQRVSRYIGWLLLTLGVCAQPILIAPQKQAFAGSSLSNLRVLKQSADGTESILTLDFIYDGIHGPTDRLLPVITDKTKPKVSSWFGANPVTISAGHGTISLKVKFFNDDPGVPPELTTDHVRVMMLSDGGNSVISEGIFSRTIKWGGPIAAIATAPLPAPQPTDEARLKDEREKRIAQERANADEAARLARLKAEVEAKTREETRLKTVAEEKAREEAAAKRIAEEKAKAEAESKTEAEAKAREEARLKAEAEEKARQATEAKAREEARLKVVAVEKARQEAMARQLAEEKAKAEVEAKAREEARQAAEAKRIAEERAKAEAETKAREEAETQRLADEKSKAQAEAKMRDEQAKRLAEEKARGTTPVQTAPATKAAFAISSKAKTKVTNIDVVNRNLDRTEMTIAVEYQYARDDGPARMGVDLASTGEPGASDYFSCPAMDIGKGSRNFVMFPVKLNVAAAQDVKHPTLPTDKVWVYLVDASGQKSYIFQGTMMLVWHFPGVAQAPAESAGGNTLEIESVKQNDLFSGYVTVKYTLRPSKGRLRLRVFDSANPASASWFASDDVPIKSGPGLELVKITVPKAAPSPDVFNADMVEIQMLDAKGAVLTTLRKQLPMSWAKPK